MLELRGSLVKRLYCVPFIVDVADYTVKPTPLIIYLPLGSALLSQGLRGRVIVRGSRGDSQGSR